MQFGTTLLSRIGRSASPIYSSVFRLVIGNASANFRHIADVLSHVSAPTENAVAEILKMFRNWRLTRDWPEMSWVELRRIGRCEQGVKFLLARLVYTWSGA